MYRINYGSAAHPEVDRGCGVGLMALASTYLSNLGVAFGGHRYASAHPVSVANGADSSYAEPVVCAA